MPIYDIICPVHGERSVLSDMATGMARQVQCDDCGRVEVGRNYGAVYEISDNNFPGAGRLSTQLSPDGKPIQINTRSEERVLMKMAGVEHYEPGQLAEHKKAQRMARERARDERRAEGVGRLYYAKNHPGSRQR